MTEGDAVCKGHIQGWMSGLAHDAGFGMSEKRRDRQDQDKDGVCICARDLYGGVIDAAFSIVVLCEPDPALILVTYGPADDFTKWTVRSF
nr:hypothetical protein CFP56_36408 [Quercus suber]